MTAHIYATFNILVLQTQPFQIHLKLQVSIFSPEQMRPSSLGCGWRFGSELVVCEALRGLDGLEAAGTNTNIA